MGKILFLKLLENQQRKVILHQILWLFSIPKQADLGKTQFFRIVKKEDNCPTTPFQYSQSHGFEMEQVKLLTKVYFLSRNGFILYTSLVIHLLYFCNYENLHGREPWPLTGKSSFSQLLTPSCCTARPAQNRLLLV